MFIKDITYPPAGIVNNPKMCDSMLRHASTGGTAAYVRAATLLLQAKEGAQLWVAKDVSDDMLVADLDPDDIKFAEVEWPEQRLEVFFEDPAIPTMLAASSSDLEMHQAVERLVKKKITVSEKDAEKLRAPTRFVTVQTEDHEGSALSVTYPPEDIDRFAAGELTDTRQTETDVSTSMDDEETSTMKDLTVLLFKVLLLISSEGHAVRRTREKPTRRQGGKPGFKNRPTTDRLIVEYLPRHLEERRSAALDAAKSDTSRQFKGRRGHWRRFRSPKFVNARGKKRFIYPVMGPDGTLPRKKFVARKLSAP